MSIADNLNPVTNMKEAKRLYGELKKAGFPVESMAVSYSKEPSIDGSDFLNKLSERLEETGGKVNYLNSVNFELEFNSNSIDEIEAKIESPPTNFNGFFAYYRIKFGETNLDVWPSSGNVYNYDKMPEQDKEKFYSVMENFPYFRESKKEDKGFWEGIKDTFSDLIHLR